MSFSDYIPHGMIVTLGTIVAYVFKEHVDTDKERYAEFKSDTKDLSDKLDRHYTDLMTAVSNAANAAATAAGEAKAAREIISAPAARRRVRRK